jgi:hypothetical protein
MKGNLPQFWPNLIQAVYEADPYQVHQYEGVWLWN